MNFLFHIPSGEQVTWYDWGLASRWPITLLLVLAAAAGVYCFYLYGRRDTPSRGRRVLLGSLRAAVLLLLLLVLFEPVLNIETVVPLRRTLLVLVDHSASMKLADHRTQADAVAAAALAMGKAQYPAAALEADLAAAETAMQRALAAMQKAASPDRVADAQALAAEALQRAARDAANTQGTAQSIGLTAVLNTQLQDMLRDQRALHPTGSVPDKTFSREAPPERSASPGSAADDGKTQAILRDQVTALLEQVRKFPVDGAGAAVGEPTRLALAQGALTQPQLALLKTLGDRFDLHAFSFGDKLEPLALGDAGAKDANTGAGATRALASLKADAPATALGSAIRQAVGRYSGRPIAGVVVLTDGASNRGTAPRDVAEQLGEQSIRLYPIGVGLPAPPDVRVDSLIAADLMFEHDVAHVQARVAADGYAGRSVRVTATMDGKEVASKLVALTAAGQFVDLAFQPQGPAGTKLLEVSVTAQTGEASTANNRVQKPVRITDQKIQVLYVEQKPRWEYRYLRKVLERDPRLNVKFLMTQGDRELATVTGDDLPSFPTTKEAVFKYDLIILGDVPARYFTHQQLQWVQELVQKHGGSLLMIAGHQDAPYSYPGTPVADMLPVRLGHGGRRMVPPNVHPISAPDAGLDSFAVLEPNARANDVAWRPVHPLWDLPALDGLKPAAHLIMTLSDQRQQSSPYPLMAWQRVGLGKCLYLGTGSTWRLRFKRGNLYYARFWGQTIQFLTLSRLMGDNKLVQIHLAKRRLNLGQSTTVTAHVLNRAYAPVRADAYALTVRPRQGAATETLTLQPVPGKPGLFQGDWTPRQVGTLMVTAAGPAAADSNQVDVDVRQVPLEQLEPRMQEASLREMAAASGGRYFSLRQLPELPAVVAGHPSTMQRRHQRQLWDLPLVLVILVFAAGTEWSLRRWWNLL